MPLPLLSFSCLRASTAPLADRCDLNPKSKKYLCVRNTKSHVLSLLYIQSKSCSFRYDLMALVAIGRL